MEHGTRTSDILRTLLIRTCQDQSDESQRTIAVPQNEARTDDMSHIRPNILCSNRLLLRNAGKHLLWKTTTEQREGDVHR